MKLSTFHIFKRTVRYARPFWLHIILLFILNLLATPIALLKPIPLKLIIDNGFGSLPVPAFIRTFFPGNFDFTFQTIVLIAAGLVIVTALIENVNKNALDILNISGFQEIPALEANVNEQRERSLQEKWKYRDDHPQPAGAA